MTLSHALYAFFADLKLQAAVVVIFVDFVLGVLAAWKQRNFRLSYLADFGRNDVCFKLIPWLVIYVASKFAGQQQLVIPGLTLGTAAMAVYVTITTAWAASIASSLSILGLPATGARQSLWGLVTAEENAAPPKS